MATTSKPRKLATIKDPAIAAVIGEHFRLPDETTAQEKLEWLKARFIVSRRTPEEELKQPALLMWIRGFATPKSLQKKGYLGQFALIGYKKCSDGSYTLFPTLIDMELSQHPERRYNTKKSQHPNWGHPLLREIKKGYTYPNVAEAAARLEMLHRQYPHSSIPGDHKLYLMIFSRATEGKKPLTKYVFTIKPEAGGSGCNIEWAENTYKPKPKPKGPTKLVKGDAEPMGFFATRVTLSKRGRRTVLPPSSNGGESDI